LPLDLAKQPEIDAVVSTSNKCLEGLPGVVFVVVRHDAIELRGHSSSWSFDLADILDQSRRDGGGSFRFTPAAQAVVALDRALDFFDEEGGQQERLLRYQENARVLWQGMNNIGLRTCLPQNDQGPIVLNVLAPPDPQWQLYRFVDFLKADGFTISNFYNTAAPSFRVGCIGHVMPTDMEAFCQATDRVLELMGIKRRC
jgi:2-aminoethylphosphonate-pyruvate transaminase